MPQIINTNMASLNAQRNLDKSQSANQKALERLSSGLRINGAKDDAAGLAISTRFTSQIKGLNVAVRNAGDGIALAQTAEGALGSVNDSLQRIRELAVQSSNATNSDVDREALQAEVEQLVNEISRTAEETNFNGRKLLDGSFQATFQIGANAGQTMDVSIAELTADKLGSSNQAGVSAIGTSTSLENGDLSINGVAIRASIASDDYVSFAENEKSAISKVTAINEVSDETGVRATVDENVVLGADMSEAGSAAAATTITLNGVDIAIEGTANANESQRGATRGSVIEAINSRSEQTGVVATDGGEDGGVILTAADGRNITVTSAANDISVYGLFDGDTTAGSAIQSQAGFTLTAMNAATSINIEGGDNTGNGNIANSGLQLGNYDSQTAFTSSVAQTVGGADAATLGVLTSASPATTAVFDSLADELGITVGTPAGILTADFQDALDDAGFNVTVAGNTVGDVANAINEAAASLKALQSGDLTINDVAIEASSSLDDTASDGTASSSDVSASGIAIAAAINESSAETGVYAEVNETVVTGGEAAGSLAFGANGSGAVTVGANISLSINNVTVTLTETANYEKNKANAITAINEVSGQTGVVASDNGETLTLTAADGRNISLFADSINAAENITDVDTALSNFGLSTNSVGVDTGVTGVDTLGYANAAKTTYSSVTLKSASAFEVSYGVNGVQGLTDSGFVAGTFGGGLDGQSLTSIDISSFEGAQEALVAVDNAIGQVASQRANLGAVQNRLESTVSNLQVNAENLNAANSRILDADFAAETAELSRTQVLQQAGISVLAQANAAGQQVLSLLG
jgi:flagellin